MIWVITGGIFSGIIFLLLFSDIKIYVHYSFDGTENFLQIKGKVFFGMLSFKKRILPQQSENGMSAQKPFFQERETTGEREKKEMLQKDKITTTDGKTSPLEQIDHFFEVLGSGYQLLKSFLRQIKILRFIWVTEIGTGDAASTGIATGCSWALKGNMLAIMRQLFNLQTKPRIRVYANFHNPVIRTNFHCMFQVKVGKTILAGIKAFLVFRKLKKGQNLKNKMVKEESTL